MKGKAWEKSSPRLVVALLGFEPSPSPNVNSLECSPLAELQSRWDSFSYVGSTYIITYTHKYITLYCRYIYYTRASVRVSFVQDGLLDWYLIELDIFT